MNFRDMSESDAQRHNERVAQGRKHISKSGVRLQIPKSGSEGSGAARRSETALWLWLGTALMPKHANRVDGNQAELVRAIRKAGVVWIPTTGDPTIGFDGVAAFRNLIIAVEIKDPQQPPSKRRLTETEQKRRDELASVGAPYLIAEYPEDVFAYFKALAVLRET